MVSAFLFFFAMRRGRLVNRLETYLGKQTFVPQTPRQLKSLAPKIVELLISVRILSTSANGRRLVWLVEYLYRVFSGRGSRESDCRTVDAPRRGFYGAAVPLE